MLVKMVGPLYRKRLSQTEFAPVCEIVMDVSILQTVATLQAISTPFLKDERTLQCPARHTGDRGGFAADDPGVTVLGTTGVKESWAKNNAVQQAKRNSISRQSKYQYAQEPVWIDGQELSDMVTVPVHFVQLESLFLMDEDCTVTLSCYSERQNLRTVFWPPAGLAKSDGERKDCVVPFQQLST